tara:strand:+ start:103697 stop:104971 length:1275 start_codon:yes stop_codon:yes gene_type:complete
MIFEDNFFNQFIQKPSKGKERIYRFLSKVGHPQKKINKTIHITGTNGKGSTIAFLHSCLKANKLSSNVYTSPHLLKINERFIINDKIISDDLLSHITNKFIKIHDDKELSFFEFITSCALELFSKSNSDWNLIEVGMGGLHDPTNIIERKDLSIITTISYDHEEFLGKDLKMIAEEKLGIIPDGGFAIFGPQEKFLKQIILDHLNKKNAKGIFYNQDWFIERRGDQIIYQDKAGELEFETLGLDGEYQILNAGLCIASLKSLHRMNKIDISDEIIIQGLKNTKLLGRLSKLTSNIEAIIDKGSEVLIDGCHNPSAAKIISQEMINLNSKEKKNLFIILGLSRNRSLIDFILNFKGIAKEITIIPIEGIKSASLKDIKNKTIFSNEVLQESKSLKDAIQKYSKFKNSRILICGSLYLVSEALKIN